MGRRRFLLCQGSMDNLSPTEHETLNRNIIELGGMVQQLLDAIQARTLNMSFAIRQPAGSAVPGGIKVAQQLGDSEQIVATIAPKDRAGNPAAVEAGKTVWSSSDETVLTVTAIDESSALVVAVGPLGTATVTVSADADLGEGVVPVTDSADVEIVAGQASNLGLGFGAPQPKP